MKKVFYLVALFTGLTAAASPKPVDVNEKILKAFKETFTEAKDVTWMEYTNYTQANFKLDEVEVRAQYSDDGTLLKTYRYYKEKQLLPIIVAKLKKRYPGREIDGVTELTSDDEISFTINLKDDKNWYIIKSDVYGNLQQMDKYKKA
jgi:hypothetical protein